MSNPVPIPSLPGSTVFVPPPAIADHDLLCVIGRGAYGEVWLARHTRLGTLRAVKIVRRDQFGDSRPFQREFDGIRRYEPISRGHANLVNILHVGGTDEVFYYVMELAEAAGGVRGVMSMVPSQPPSSKPSSKAERTPLNFESETLDPRDYAPHTLRSELRQHVALPIGRCTEIGHALASALAHLHVNKLVHRDVKPSNVIFVGGAPKLADIGLVAGVDDARSFVGTEGYVPLDGAGKPSADCYALGKLLYELSTGHDRTAWPAPPADLATRPDRERLIELNAILHRACAPDPRHRYANAAAMLADLELLQRGKSIKRNRRFEQRVGFFKKAFVIVVLFAAVIVGARFISNALRPTEYVPKLSSNDEASDLYYMGRRFYQKNTGDALRQAIDYFQKAIDKDPNFAQAHAALASSYCWGLEDFDVDFVKARQHAERALALDVKLAEAHKVMAWVKYKVDWDWPGSDKEFKRALELGPHDPTVHEWYGIYLSGMDRFDDSIREIKKAEQLDGVSLSIRMLLGISYLNARKDELAMSELHKVISLETNSPSVAYLRLADLYEWRGEFVKAVELRERWSRLANREDADSVSRKYGELRAAYAKDGPAGYWQKRIQWAKRDNDLHILPGLYAQIGDANGAFAALEAEFERHSSALPAALMNDRALDSLRSDPGFARLLRDMKLK